MKQGNPTVDRLTTIEATLQAISEKLDVVVRLEERQDGQARRLDRADGRMDMHSKRIGTLEQTVAANNTQTGMIERAAWVVMSAAVGMLAYFLKG